MSENKLTFQALLLANEQRNAYGLRYNDYERYRKHCANRTHRLRSSLKITHGKGREFKKVPPAKTEAIKDGYLQLLLFEAERAWVYSRELSTLASADKEKATALKRNATSRFRRSVNWATQLLSHCQALHATSRLSAESLIQATVYTLILNGRFLSSRDEYEDALIQLSVARSLLDELASRAATSRDQALATAFADEIGPQIRYCAHELRRAKAYDVDAIVSEIASKHKNEIVEGYDALVKELVQETAGGAEAERKKLRPVMWEGEPVPVRNPELVDVLLRVQEAEKKLKEAPSEKQSSERTSEGSKEKGRVGKGARSKRGVAAYDAILLALSDAEEVSRKLVEAQQLSGSSAASPTGTRDMQFVHAYIVYQLLSRRIQRDLLLISTLLHQSQSTSHHARNKAKASTSGPSPSVSKKPRQKEQVDARLFPAVVKLLDTIIQSLNQMRTLSVVDDSPDLASAVEARISYTKARRCRYLARCYVPSKKYAEALTLTQHGTLHLRETHSLLGLLEDSDPISSGDDGDSSFYPLTSSDISTLEEELSADSLQCKKDWFAFNGGVGSGERMATGSDGNGKTGHKKPLFFDIALNYVQLDMDRLQDRAGKKQILQQQKQKQYPVETPRVAVTAAATSQNAKQRQMEQENSNKKTLTSKAKAKIEEVVERAPTPEPSEPARGGLSTLLGGWWGRK